MGSVAQLWNPRSDRRLRRYWIAFEDRIIIRGENLEQAGVLSVRPTCNGELRAQLRVMGCEYEEAVNVGKDIAVWINGLELFIGVKAVDDKRMLVAFGIAPGAKVIVTLEAGGEVEEDANAFPGASHGADRHGSRCPIGLCQTEP